VGRGLIRSRLFGSENSPPTWLRPRRYGAAWPARRRGPGRFGKRGRPVVDRRQVSTRPPEELCPQESPRRFGVSRAHWRAPAARVRRRGKLGCFPGARLRRGLGTSVPCADGGGPRRACSVCSCPKRIEKIVKLSEFNIIASDSRPRKGSVIALDLNAESFAEFLPEVRQPSAALGSVAPWSRASTSDTRRGITWVPVPDDDPDHQGHRSRRRRNQRRGIMFKNAFGLKAAQPLYVSIGKKSPRSSRASSWRWATNE